VPLLGDIPFLGALFRYETRERNRTNTMVFLRPIIVRDESTSAAIATERYEYMRTQMADARVPDTLIFRDLNVAPIPPAAARSAQPPAAAPPGETTPAPAAPSGGTTPAAASPPAGAVQVLHITTMPDLAGGRHFQQELRNSGFDAFIEPMRTSTGEIYRVRVAVDTAKRTVDDAMAELKRLGYNPIPVKR
jgi:general secretion pathway protein D